MNKKLIKYCSETLTKMVNYHNLTDDELLEVILDLKRLLLINQINLYKISKYGIDADREFYLKLKDLLFKEYIKSNIVREWLELFITNSAISFDEVLYSADYFNAKILEIFVKVNKKIELSEKRREEIIHSVLLKVKNNAIYGDEYKYFIVNIKDKKEKEKNKLRIFKKEYVETFEGKSSFEISETEMMNTIFDYFIINKQKKENEYN